MLSGCVAAVIPLAAGAAMGTGMRSNGDMSGAGNASNEVALAAAPAAAARDQVPSAQRDFAQVPATSEPPSPATKNATLLPITELPPPSGKAADLQGTIAQFQTYALAQAAIDVAEAERQSAILAEPATLRLERTQCGELPPAVLIDIDPGKKTADPLSDIDLPSDLASALQTLRENEVRIAWISRMGDGFSDALRMQLDKRGFDRGYQDIILTLADLDQRKQTLRDALADRYCIVAMLGDERYDFDELYLYLKNEDAAFALERMIGDGWFLLPPPQSFADSAQDARLMTETGDQ